MKIERKNKVVAFKEIEDVIGTCFAYHDMVFMITPVCYCNNKQIIAMNLKNYMFIFEDEIKDYETVTVLNLKIVEE